MPSKLKVLFDANSMAGQKTGVGFYVQNIIETLAKDYGDQVELTGYYFNFLGLGDQKPPQLSSVRYKPVRWFPHKLLSLTRRLGFQIPLNAIVPSVHRFSLVFFPNFVALPLFKTPRVVVVYDLCFIDHPEYVADRNAKFLQRFVPPSLAAADGIVGISEFTKRRVIDSFKALVAPVIVAPPGLALTPKATEAGSKLQPVLYVGTIEPRKNLQNLLDAYAKLPGELQQKHPLWLAGSQGWKNEAILARIDELKSRRVSVEYKGYVSAAEKAQLYAEAAIVVLVSHYEGFGMPILEAMAADKPLLLSDIPVFTEVAGQAANYCDPADSDDIARQLKKLLTSPSQSKKALYSEILQRFTWQKSAGSILELFKQIAR